jgi:hypothetical protein
MGIKFNCEHCGAELNVKSSLAGRKGLCPKCNEKIQVPGPRGTVQKKPVESKPKREKLNVEAIDVVEAVNSVEAEVTPVFVASGSESTPPTQSSGTAPDQPMQPQAVAIPAKVTEAPVTPFPVAAENRPMLPSTSTLPRAEPAAADPLVEDPAAIWYVRPPGGGQFGPASNDLMKQWLKEQRVGESSLVWRDGWADWLHAGQVFQQLGAGTPSFSGTPALNSTSALANDGLAGIGQNSAVSSQANAKRIEYYRNRKRRATIGLAIIFIGITTIAALIAILGYVLTR